MTAPQGNRPDSTPRPRPRLVLLLDKREQAYLEAFAGRPLTASSLIVAIGQLRLERRRARQVAA